MSSGFAGNKSEPTIPRNTFSNKQKNYMIETIALLLLILWLAGVTTSDTLGGFIHILLIIVIVVFLVRDSQGRRS